jgi:hypothetical protein
LNPRRAGGLIVGGKLYAELRRSSFERKKKEEFAAFLVELSRAGRLHKFLGENIEKKTREVEENGIRSNDPHIIALTKVTRCKVVFTEESRLESDLKNRMLIGHRVGIYKHQDHSHLLTECHCSTPEQS